MSDGDKNVGSKYKKKVPSNVHKALDKKNKAKVNKAFHDRMMRATGRASTFREEQEIARKQKERRIARKNKDRTL